MTHETRQPRRTAGRRRWVAAARAAAVPLAAGLLTLGGLAGWTAAGLAGRPAAVEVAGGRVFLPVLERQATTGVFFDIENTGGSADELLRVESSHGATMFADRELSAGSGRMVMIGGIVVPADSRLAMSPFTPNVMLELDEPLEAGEEVDFVLTFRQAGEVRVTAPVVPPGG